MKGSAKEGQLTRQRDQRTVVTPGPRGQGGGQGKGGECMSPREVAGSHSSTVVVLMSPLDYLIMAPKRKSRDAGNSDMPKGSHEVLF